MKLCKHFSKEAKHVLFKLLTINTKYSNVMTTAAELHQLLSCGNLQHEGVTLCEGCGLEKEGKRENTTASTSPEVHNEECQGNLRRMD